MDKSPFDAAIKEILAHSKERNEYERKEQEMNDNPQFILAPYVKDAINYIWNNCCRSINLDEDSLKTLLSEFSYEQKAKIIFEYKNLFNSSENKREFYQAVISLLADGLFILKEKD
jgi:hypothetical protein